MRRRFLHLMTAVSLLTASGAIVPPAVFAASSGCGSSSYRLDVEIRQRFTNSFIGSGWFSISVYRCWNGSSFTSGPSWNSRTWGGATGVFTSVSRVDNSHNLINTYWDRSMETDWSFAGTWCSHKVYQEMWLANDDGGAGSKWHGDDCLQEYLNISLH